MTRELRDPVTFTFDGEAIQGERGEPLAAALVAAGQWSLARSPKFHRPRGPSCFRAACDGCLLRVDGVPNTMSCQVDCRPNLVAESQNTLGPRNVDLLRVNDWFFPDGFNHHEFLAGVPGLNSVMQSFARRVAGLGRLPAEVQPSRNAARRHVDALVVGGGPSGLSVALELRKQGREVEVADDALFLGGSGMALDEPLFQSLVKDVLTSAKMGEIILHGRASAIGIYGDDLVLASPRTTEVLDCKTLVLAPGAHDGQLAFEGNDVPGIVSARAAGWLVRRGIRLGERVLIVVTKGGGPFGEQVEKMGAQGATVKLIHGMPKRVSGSSRVRSVEIETDSGTVREKADVLVIDTPRAPAYELCAHAGANLVHTPAGFVVTDTRIRGGVFASGEVRGVPLEPSRILDDAHALANLIRRDSQKRA